MRAIILKIIFGAMMAMAIGSASTAFSYPSFLSSIRSVLRTANWFDPSIASDATTTPTTTIKPTSERIKYYFYYAYSTYCDDELDDLNCGYCHQFNGVIDSHTVLKNETYDTLALITTSKLRKEIVVAFRGTILDASNIILDFNFFNTQVENIHVHSGFYKATMSLYNDVRTCVRLQFSKNPTFKIIIIGHSLGGAMARLTQFLFLENNEFPKAIYELYTYGEPRVGNQVFAEFFNKQTITTARTVNKADIVPHIPPTSVFGTNLLYDYYIHPQTEFWIVNDTTQIFCNQTFYEDPKCSESLEPFFSAADHSNYFNVSSMTCDVSKSTNTNGNPVQPPASSVMSSLTIQISILFSGIMGIFRNWI